MAHDHDGTHEALEAFFREGTSLAFKLVQHRQTLQQRNLQETREADRHAEQLDLLRSAALKHAHAGVLGQKVMSPEWWEKTTPGEQLKTYVELKDAEKGTPLAAAGVKAMNQQIRDQYGFDPESLAAANVPDDEIESRFAEHIARGQEAVRETRPAGFEQPMQSAEHGEGFEQAQAIAKGSGLDELAIQGLTEIHQLGLARALSDVSHVGDMRDVVESAQGSSEPQARKASLGAEQSGERSQGR
jgi:hypothetical protein